ncbi:MAG: ATP-binding protein [Coriobacteriales bacterium]|jgi:AAA+ ATPase superfamily predicted ATPase|nr:ATP-binding protein [Coriobacteriales bacterium]
MFIGREAELDTLNEMYSSDRFEFAVIYGRRRVGKTTLIKEFIKDKNAIYFLAREADGMINLKGFSNDVYAVTAKVSKGRAVFSDWERAFEYLYQISKDTRLILAIDEYPYLAGGYRPISSVIQAHIDTHLKDSKLFLILCGSSMSFMEEQVLGYKSPLYGRRTSQFKVTQFSFFESLPFFEGFENEDKAILFGCTGGIPEYLNKINPAKTVQENIIELFLTPSGHLYEEPSNLLKQELREPSTYNGVIEAIAGGASRLNEIATKCGMESNKCAKYLTSLMALGIVRKEFPVTDASSSKKSIYLLDDMMFRFWYRFVFPNMSAIASGLGKAVYEFDVKGAMSAYTGLVFEEICRQYLLEEAKRDGLPFFVGKFGRWWGNNPKEKRQEEIDILTFRKDSALFCECKWTNTLVGSRVLDDLKAQSELFTFKHTWYWLFAKTGFTDRLVREAEVRGDVRLIRFDEMVRASDQPH